MVEGKKIEMRKWWKKKNGGCWWCFTHEYPNVGVDDALVGADGLNEEGLNALLLLYDLHDLPAPLPDGVGGVVHLSGVVEIGAC